MTSVFGDWNGVLLIEIALTGTIIDAAAYRDTLKNFADTKSAKGHRRGGLITSASVDGTSCRIFFGKPAYPVVTN